MKKLAQMCETRSMTIHNGVVTTTTAVWSMLTAAIKGDLVTIERLVASCPELISCQYDYTSPLQFAAREGHFDLVRYFVENGALDPGYRNHPFLEPLTTIARDRGFEKIAQYLDESLENPSLVHARGDTGSIDHGFDEEQIRFQQVVDEGKHSEAAAMLNERPGLALDELAFWGEGIMATAANGADIKMLELLLSFGATVPALSKWGARYYFKHYEIGKFLLENGMNANHMNWREFTLLHDMAHTGNAEKAALLLDHGADIDAIDEEYSSTPLGYAAKWGNREVVSLLLERGADSGKAGAPWAAPLAWAKRKGHTEIAADLQNAGAIFGA